MAITLIILGSAARSIRQTNLIVNEMITVQPDIVFAEPLIGLIPSQGPNHGPAFHVCQLWFSNDITNPQDVATTRQVAPTITFWDVSQTTKIFEMIGKCLNALGESLHGWNDLLEAVDIEANGRIEKLISAIKYPDEDCCYGYNGKRVTGHEYQRKDVTKLLTGAEYLLHVSLKRKQHACGRLI